MKTRNKITSLVACLCIVFVAVLAAIPMFTLTASAEDGTWTLVTDASTLKAGDKVVIVAAKSNDALSTTQNKNNRSSVSVTKDTTSKTVSWTTAVQELTLENGMAAGSFAFNTGSGYLYAASSGKNYLRTETKLSNNSSWKIDIASSGVATIKAQGSNTRNWMRYNSSSKIFAAYGSGQLDVCLYKFEKSEVPAETYNATFYGPNGEINELAQNEVSIFELPDPTSYINVSDYSKYDYEFVGWATEAIENTDKMPTTYNAGSKFALKEDTVFYAVYSYFIKGEGEGNLYKLHEGNVIEGNYVIVADGEALTAEISSSRFKGTSVTIKNDTIDSPNAEVIWKVEKNGEYWTFYNESVSKYAAGSGAKNQGTLISEVTDFAKWNITEDSIQNLGNANNSVNSILRKNGTYGFATYAATTGTKPVLYKLQDGTNYYTTELEAHVCTVPEITGASIKIGDTLAMEYYVSLCSCQNIDDYTMNFTMNENPVNDVKYNKVVDGKYVFTFTNIAPQCMGDNIKAELIYNGEAVATKDNYSVKANAEWLLEKYADNEALVTLVNDLLNYGAAAQEYRDYNTENLVTDKDTTADVKPEKSDMTLTESTDETVKITAAGVYFDYNNKIYVKFVGDATVKVNGVEVEAENGIAYTDAISATEFDVVYTIELAVDGVVVQTLTYSVNSYVYAKWGTDELTAMNKLARALYAYGVSAEAYAATLD